MKPIAGSNNNRALAILFQELFFSARVRDVPQPSVKLPVLSGAIMSSDKIHRTLRKSGSVPFPVEIDFSTNMTVA
ncbi:hypothetical protein ACUH78_18775, partial [Thauera sp. ZXT1-4]|uniref:hypothetical protein n=1 Tax=Thauera sp. ZXT1-4 TaxID=3460294 RepID=UPI004040B64B